MMGSSKPPRTPEHCKHISEAKMGEKNPMFGKTLSDEHRRKISVANTNNPLLVGRKRSEQTIKRLSDSHKGKPQSTETIKKRSDAMKRIWKDPETHQIRSLSIKRAQQDPSLREYRSQAMKRIWRENLEFIERMKKAHEDPDIRQRIGISVRKLWEDPEYRNSVSGVNAPNWQGGISYEPYCPKFNKEFRARVRAFFDYRCIECGSLENGVKHSVHHVNFNKESCCDSSIPLFVLLCRSCHSKTNTNRSYWQTHFTEIINQYYGGKCYLTKEEMMTYGI